MNFAQFLIFLQMVGLNLNVIRFLVNGVSGVALVDMEGEDRTLTAEESTCAIIIPQNVGDGTKKLIFPSSTNSQRVAVVFIYGAFAENSYTVKAQGNATTAVCRAYNDYIFSVTDSLGVTNFAPNLFNQSRQSGNPISSVSALSGEFSSDDAGKKIRFTSTGGAQAFSFQTTAAAGYPDDMIIYAYCPPGTDGCTITGGDATLSPASVVLAAGDSAVLQKDGSTDNWYQVG